MAHTTFDQRETASVAARRGPLRSLAVVSAGVFVAFMLLSGIGVWNTVARELSDRASGRDSIAAAQDYIAFYAAGSLVADGRGKDIYDLNSVRETEEAALDAQPAEVGGVLPFFNPPFLAALMAPLSSLTATNACLVLSGLNVVGLLAALGLFIALVKPRGTLQTALLSIWFLSLAPIVANVLNGQVSLLLFMGWALFALMQMKGRQSLSGAGLALMLVKPQSLILIVTVLAWKRQWRPLAVLGSISAVLVLVSIAVAGPGVLISYPRFLIESMSWHRQFGVTTTRMYSISGFVSRIADQGSMGYYAFTFALMAVVAGCVVYAIPRRYTASGREFASMIGMLICGELLLNAHLYFHGLMPLALSAGLGLYAAKDDAGATRRWVAMMAIVWLSLHFGLDALNSGVNIVTPAIALVFLGHFVTLLQARAGAVAVGDEMADVGLLRVA